MAQPDICFAKPDIHIVVDHVTIVLATVQRIGFLGY